jgi:ATP-dependent DNA ligase
MNRKRGRWYPSGRSNDWVEKTCAQRETLPIAGFALDGTKWDELYIGRRKGLDLIYAGKVDHGFDKASTAELQSPSYGRRSLMRSASRTGTFGSNRSCSPNRVPRYVRGG